MTDYVFHNQFTATNQMKIVSNIIGILWKTCPTYRGALLGMRSLGHLCSLPLFPQGLIETWPVGADSLFSAAGKELSSCILSYTCQCLCYAEIYWTLKYQAFHILKPIKDIKLLGWIQCVLKWGVWTRSLALQGFKIKGNLLKESF